MPIRDYTCKQCKHEFENLYTSFSAEERERPELRCPKCASPDLDQGIATKTSFALKTKGYYQTDYPNKKRR